MINQYVVCNFVRGASTALHLLEQSHTKLRISYLAKGIVAGFLGYPQPGGGAHPPIPRGGELGDRLGDWADLALKQAHKNTMI